MLYGSPILFYLQNRRIMRRALRAWHALVWEVVEPEAETEPGDFWEIVD